MAPGASSARRRTSKRARITDPASSVYGPFRVPGPYLVGIEFGLNDVNEYHLLLVEPKGIKYLYMATERGALTLSGKGSDLFLHHCIDSDDWGRAGTIPYSKYDPIKKVLVKPKVTLPLGLR